MDVSQEERTKQVNRGNAWIQVFSGGRVWPLDLRPEDIRIEDVARSLAVMPRFTGHTRCGPYSIAQHSVLVSRHCDPEDALTGLLHDAPEYVLTDLPSPLKKCDAMEAYRRAEDQAWRTVARKFGLPEEMPASVHTADVLLLATEARDLMSPLHPEWSICEANGYPVLPERIRPWSWRKAERRFLRRFRELTGGNKSWSGVLWEDIRSWTTSALESLRVTGRSA